MLPMLSGLMSYLKETTNRYNEGRPVYFKVISL